MSTSGTQAVPGAAASHTTAEGELVAVRRRRRRRRRRHDRGDTPTTRLHLALLCLIGCLLLVSLMGPEVRHQAVDSIRHLIPAAAVDISRRLELIALAVAGLVLIYLTPGVEDRVLRILGIKRERHTDRR